jgi:hypothetical protein
MPRPKPMCSPSRSRLARVERVHDLKYTPGESAGFSYEQASGKLSWSAIASRKKAPTRKRRGFPGARNSLDDAHNPVRVAIDDHTPVVHDGVAIGVVFRDRIIGDRIRQGLADDHLALIHDGGLRRQGRARDRPDRATHGGTDRPADHGTDGGATHGPTHGPSGVLSIGGRTREQRGCRDRDME